MQPFNLVYSPVALLSPGGRRNGPADVVHLKPARSGEHDSGVEGVGRNGQSVPVRRGADYGVCQSERQAARAEQNGAPARELLPYPTREDEIILCGRLVTVQQC